MLQIDKMDCSAIGYIQKPHGIKGEVVVVFDDGSSDAYDSLVYVFVELDGGLVPFFISDEGLRFRNNESVIVKFDFVDSQEKAKELAGCNLFVLNSDLIEPESPEIHSELIGMNVIDNKSGELGKIIRIDDFSGNVVITVAHPRAEILIPLSDDIITGIDDKKRKIFLTCPDGLIKIYLE